MADTKKFYEMWNLMGQAVREEPSLLVPDRYSIALLVVICWEESCFRNLVQDSGWDAGNAVGFGQVGWRYVNDLFGFKGDERLADPKQKVLTDELFSAKLVVKAMLSYDRLRKGDRVGALNYYAAGSKKVEGAHPIAQAWMEAETALQAVPAVGKNTLIGEADALKSKTEIIAALNKTGRRENNGFKPYIDKLF